MPKVYMTIILVLLLLGNKKFMHLFSFKGMMFIQGFMECVDWLESY